MSELISSLGIDMRLLVAQVVNFFILFVVLERFLFKPIFRVIDERKKTVEENEEHAEELTKKLEKIEKEHEEMKRTAKREAAELLEETKNRAGDMEERIKREAHESAEKILAAAEVSGERKVEELRRELKGEMGELVIYALEKSIPGKLDEEAQANIVGEALEILKDRPETSK